MTKNLSKMTEKELREEVRKYRAIAHGLLAAVDGLKVRIYDLEHGEESHSFESYREMMIEDELADRGLDTINEDETGMEHENPADVYAHLLKGVPYAWQHHCSLRDFFAKVEERLGRSLSAIETSFWQGVYCSLPDTTFTKNNLTVFTDGDVDPNSLATWIIAQRLPNS